MYHNSSHRYAVDSGECTSIEKLKWKSLLPSTDKVTQRIIDRLFVVDSFNIKINSDVDDSNIDDVDDDDDVVDDDDDDSIEVVRIRFIGESFLTGQIRSIIGLLLSVYHGYLPMVMVILLIIMMMMMMMMIVVLKIVMIMITIVVVLISLFMIMVVMVIIVIMMTMIIIVVMMMMMMMKCYEYKRMLHFLSIYLYRNSSNILNDLIL